MDIVLLQTVEVYQAAFPLIPILIGIGIGMFLSDSDDNTSKMADGGAVDYENGGTIGNKNPHEYTYMMLDRLRSDADYFLGAGNRNENHLWAGSVDSQISEMKKLWNSLPQDGKPEWLTMEEIQEYETKMKNP